MKSISVLLDEAYREKHLDYIRMVGGGQDAEDIVQNAYVNALTYWTEDVKEFSHWFSIILMNCAKKSKKEERLHGMACEIEGIVYPQPDIYTDVMTIEIKRIIDTHPKSHILKRYFILQQSSKEIEMQVVENHNNIRVIIHRFRGEMNKKYKGD